MSANSWQEATFPDASNTDEEAATFDDDKCLNGTGEISCDAYPTPFKTIPTARREGDIIGEPCACSEGKCRYIQEYGIAFCVFCDPAGGRCRCPCRGCDSSDGWSDSSEGSSADAERITDAKCSTTRACNIASRYMTSAPRAIAQPLVRRHTNTPSAQSLRRAMDFQTTVQGRALESAR